MDGPPDKRRSCTRKRAYGSLKQAALVARAVMRKNPAVQMHAYPCEHCGQFHIGRQLRGQE